MTFIFIIMVDDLEVKRESIKGPCSVKEYDEVFYKILKEAENKKGKIILKTQF